MKNAALEDDCLALYELKARSRSDLSFSWAWRSSSYSLGFSSAIIVAFLVLRKMSPFLLGASTGSVISCLTIVCVCIATPSATALLAIATVD
jgi:hypothetical protein